MKKINKIFYIFKKRNIKFKYESSNYKFIRIDTDKPFMYCINKKIWAYKKNFKFYEHIPIFYKLMEIYEL